MRSTMLKVLVAALALGATTACNFDQLLSVKTPSRLADMSYLVPANAALISASAVADYECALGGYAVASGLAANELVETTQTAQRWSYDRRNTLAVEPSTSPSDAKASVSTRRSTPPAIPMIKRCKSSKSGPTRRSRTGSG
ncbi:hypothetical protein [Gemmatimonas sp.]|uniref:hypothetical protein n=1 Tax=Gemmatimonas sp. TaxID=1962908 RepID=UPI003561E5C5